MAAERSSLSVCVVTYERAAFLERCLTALVGELTADAQIVVVDASADDHSHGVARVAPAAVYVHAPHLAGWMTKSRNEALRWATGDIIAFLDDDVVVCPRWSRELLACFEDPTVAAVAGRTRNLIPGEELYDLPIGRLRDDGTLTDGFASDPPGPVEVDHGIGANMSFRRGVLGELGGFRDDYPGTALREDTDIFLRIRRLGRRVVFAPDAVVIHRPADHVKGARFDTRYKLYARRNHMVLLARHDGIGSRRLRRWIARDFARVAAARGVRAKAKRLGVVVLGTAWGAAAMLRQARWRPMDPVRRDRAGREVRSALTGAPV